MAERKGDSGSRGALPCILDEFEFFSKTFKVVLASKSPRRREILETMGIPSENIIVWPSTFEEDLDKSLFKEPHEYVRATAKGKGDEVAVKFFGDKREPEGEEPHVVISADTVVELDGHILEKPADRDEAIRMLSMLSGKAHRVHTAVWIYTRNGEPQSFTAESTVQFSLLTKETMEGYVQTGEPFDKAGGYGVQTKGGNFVESIHGCYYNVMGLPMHPLSQNFMSLRKSGQI